MFKKMIAFLLVAVMAIGTTTTSFAADRSQLNLSNPAKSGSYTYEDLGTTINYFTTDTVLNSVSLLTRAILGTSNISSVLAKKAAQAAVNNADKFTGNTVYYSLHTHRTLVKLDGEFSHYLIDETVYLYSDARRNHLIKKLTHSGQSLDPTRVKDELIK